VENEKGRLLKRSSSKDCYEVLGVARNASAREITKAYRERVSRYHPDKHQGNELKDLAEEKLAELNEAYEILSDASRRAAYDAERRQAGFADSTPHPYGRMSIAPFPYRRFVILLAFLGGAYFAFRFIRNPRVGAVIGAALGIAWFGPRIYRFFKSKKT
jgi:curved DNA-binding protein CbpA